jgi:hypothetical protein
MEVHVCLENCERGLFITTEESARQYKNEDNPRVEPQMERKVLDEYKKAKFDALNDDVSVAESENFIFRKYESEKDASIVWVEPVRMDSENKVII